MTIKKNKYLLVLDKCSKEYISKHFLNYNTFAQVLGKMLGNLQFLKLKHQVMILSNTWCSNGADGRNRTGTVYSTAGF